MDTLAAAPGTNPGEVLVRVAASSVNRTDRGIRAAAPPLGRLISGPRSPRHPILGCEFGNAVLTVASDRSIDQ